MRRLHDRCGKMNIIDTSYFLEGHKQYYLAMKCVCFWLIVNDQEFLRTSYSIEGVRGELLAWKKRRKRAVDVLRFIPSPPFQFRPFAAHAELKQMVKLLCEKYDLTAELDDFLKVDAKLVAQALKEAEGAVVVTDESAHGLDGKGDPCTPDWPKIPDVCEMLGVRHESIREFIKRQPRARRCGVCRI